MLLSACAPVPPARSPLGGERATLEIVNRAEAPVQVAIDGWTLGVVASGARRRFREIAPGRYRVTAQAGARTTSRDMTLPGGKEALWVLLPPDGIAPRPFPAPFGALRLTNASGHDLEVRLGKGALRTILAGDSLSLTDVRAGDIAIHLAVPRTRYRRTLQVRVPGGATVEKRLDVDSGRLEIVNTTGEPVRFRLDGRSIGAVAHGQRHVIEHLLVGVHRLIGTGLTTGREHHRLLAITPLARLVWDIAADRSRLVLRNRAGEALAIHLDGASRGTIAAGAQLALADVASGTHRVLAAGAHATWSAEITIAAGQVATWTVRAGVGTLRVRNELSEPLEIRIRGERVATVAPGETAFRDQLPAGTLRVAVFGTISKVAQRRTVVIDPAESAVWTVAAPLANLHVRNQLAEPVIVYFDGHPLGRVDAHKELVFTQVPPGHRLLEARGELSSTTIRDDQDVRSDRLVVWDISVAVGIVEVENHSGEALLAPLAVRVTSEEVPSEQTRRFNYPAGNRVLHFVGKESGLPYHLRMAIARGKVHRWVVRPLRGQVVVINHTPEPQTLAVDGAPQAAIPSRARKIVELRAGPHRLVAMGTKTQDAVEGSLLVRPGATTHWEIRRKLGHLRILNETAEPVDLRRAGEEPLGWIAPGSNRVYGPWAPGSYTITAQGRWSRAIYEMRVTLETGRVEAWHILPARGVVVVHNHRDEAVRVLLDQAEVGLIEPGHSGRYPVPLGPHAVETVGRTTQKSFRRRLKVRPDRAYTLQVPRGPAQVVVVNKLSFSLDIRLGNLARGTVAPGGTLAVPIRDLGDVIIYADGPGGRLTWHRRVRIGTDREVRWEITP